MSLRLQVDRSRIELFLKSLADRFRRPCRIHLVGGTTLVFEGLRQQTMDIDVVLEVAPANHGELIQAVRDLKDNLSINVEEASPGDFIPLPSGYENRHIFVGRFGMLEVLHFDLYSTALSKIERGREQDLEDVLTLLRTGRIEWDKLVAYFQEILPKMGEHSLKQDSVEFEQNFRALKALWQSMPGSTEG
jgi:hypothetical protein